MKAIPSPSTAAAVRRYYGLSQIELAQFLGLTRGQVAHIEAGRRRISYAGHCQLNLLADQLPTEDEAPAAPASTLPLTDEPLAPNSLRRRQRRCEHKVRNLRWQLDSLETRASSGVNPSSSTQSYS